MSHSGSQENLCQPKRSLIYESPGGLAAGASVYEGQESRPFASTALREHRPPGSRSRAAEITSRADFGHFRPRSCSPAPRAGESIARWFTQLGCTGGSANTSTNAADVRSVSEDRWLAVPGHAAVAPVWPCVALTEQWRGRTPGGGVARVWRDLTVTRPRFCPLAACQPFFCSCRPTA